MSSFCVRASSRASASLRRARNPFCGVCKKAGKAHSVYTSHFVRDKPNGKIVCPTLLSTECRYCHDLGHTKTHCPKLAEKAQRRSRYEKQQRTYLKKQKAEDSLRAQVEAAQQEQGQTFIAMNYGNSTVRIPVKCQAASTKKAQKQRSVGSVFAAFCSDSDDSDDEQDTVAVPAVVQPRQPIGCWGNGAAAVAQVATISKPQAWKKPKRVTFKHDNADALMKPPASEERFYIKGSPTNEFSHKMELQQDQPMKRSANAWKPRRIRERTTSVDSYDLALQCDEEFRPKKPAAPRSIESLNRELRALEDELENAEDTGNWADDAETADLEKKIEALEEELERAEEAQQQQRAQATHDQFGRPTTDNSAW